MTDKKRRKRANRRIDARTGGRSDKKFMLNVVEWVRWKGLFLLSSRCSSSFGDVWNVVIISLLRIRIWMYISDRYHGFNHARIFYGKCFLFLVVFTSILNAYHRHPFRWPKRNCGIFVCVWLIPIISHVRLIYAIYALMIVSAYFHILLTSLCIYEWYIFHYQDKCTYDLR